MEPVFRIYHCTLSTTCVVPDGTPLSYIKEKVFADMQRHMDNGGADMIKDIGIVCTGVERG